MVLLGVQSYETIRLWAILYQEGNLFNDSYAYAMWKKREFSLFYILLDSPYLNNGNFLMSNEGKVT